MRIVGGSFKGRALKAPRSDAVRPTTDRARESLFNILEHSNLFSPSQEIDGARVIDVFAGTGALGLEALSRGAAFALFVDASIEGRSLIRHNIEACGVAAKARLFKRDATRLGSRGSMAPFTLGFLDPPYAQRLAESALSALHQGTWLEPGALVIVEESASVELSVPAGFTIAEIRGFGGSQIIFLRYSGER